MSGKNKMWRFLFEVLFPQIILDGFFIYLFYGLKVMYFVKDFFLVTAILFFLLQEHVKDYLGQLGRGLGRGVVICMVGLFVLGAFQVFNPYSRGLTRGLLGLKVMFEPWLVMPLAYAYFSDSKILERFFKGFAILSIPVNAFGLLQYIKGPYFMINTFGPGFIHNTQSAMVHGYTDTFVRIIGTFASAAHYSLFINYNIMVCFALFLSKTKPRWLWATAIFQSFFCALGTGSRGGLVSLLLMFFIFSLTLKNVRSVTIGFVLLGVCFFAGFHTLGPIVSKRFASALDSKNLRERTIDTTPAMFMQLLTKYPMGKGMGSASQASRYLGKIEGEFSLIENYPSKLQMELGFPGVVLFLILLMLLFMRWFILRQQFYDFDDIAYYFYIALSAYVAGTTIAVGFPDSPPATILFFSALATIPRLASFQLTQPPEIYSSEDV